MVGATALEKGGGKVEEQGMLFEYTIKFLLLASFLELILYRLVSRLGMHLGKLAAKYEAVRLLFKGLSSIGFALLNFVSLLVFLAISLLLFSKMKEAADGRYDAWLIPAMALLLILTVAFLIVPPAMLGGIIYNVVSVAVLIILAVEYFRTHRLWIQRVTILCFLLGVFSWLYYQTVSTAYGFLGLSSVPPLVHEVNRAGEALIVLSSILLLWAYGDISLKSKNVRQRRRVILFARYRSSRLSRASVFGLRSRAVRSSGCGKHSKGGRRYRVDLPNGHGLHLLFAVCLLCRRLILLVVRRLETNHDGASGRVRAWIDVHGRLRIATVAFDAHGHARIHVAEPG